MNRFLGQCKRQLTFLAKSFALVASGLLFFPGAAADTPRSITVASTTSTEYSGLFAWLLPRFTAETGIEVRVVAVGTGQAIRIAMNGDADVLLVHHPASEQQFVADGFGIARHPVMHNDFVIVGPNADPANVRRTRDAAEGLARIATAKATFVSRGDDSGTHKKELALWEATAIDPRPASGDWYRETGSGMGSTLNTASAMDAYTLTDRATWVAFGNRGDLAILLEGDQRLYNPYSVIAVNPARHPHTHSEEAQAFVDWLISERGQKAIAAFRVSGQQVFFPDAFPGAEGADDD